MNAVAAQAIARDQVRVRVHDRIEAVDLARGVAVALMILSHGINALLDFGDFTDWGLVPVHAVTKFSSSLFFVVFGAALAIAFVPKTGAADWPRRRRKLMLRGLLVLFWYKVLTVVELHDTRDWDGVQAALLYQDFPSYVEILGFYAIALLWIPWVLPAWRRAPGWLRWSSPLIVTALCWALLRNFGFWGVPQLQALFVEHHDYYTWGQLSRLPLVLMGLLLGGLLLHMHHDQSRRLLFGAAVALAGLATLAVFQQLAGSGMAQLLPAIARNAGKHPPELMFMLFSVGGALLLFGLCVAGGNLLAALLRPLTVIGTDALMAFIVHITVIFALWRAGLGLAGEVSYGQALGLTVLLMAFSALWIAGWQRARQALRRRRQ